VGDIRKLPYKKRFFDVVVDVVTIQHVPFSDHKKVYSEIFRVLKPKGYFWSLHIANKSWGDRTGKLIDYKTFENLSDGPLTDVGITCLPTDKDLKELLLKKKFKIQNIEKHIRTYENQKKQLIHWIIVAKK